MIKYRMSHLFLDFYSEFFDQENFIMLYKNNKYQYPKEIKELFKNLYLNEKFNYINTIPKIILIGYQTQNEEISVEIFRKYQKVFDSYHLINLCWMED